MTQEMIHTQYMPQDWLFLYASTGPQVIPSVTRRQTGPTSQGHGQYWVKYGL
jgi:hypothetical protein